jgi:hypothetical protein
MAATPITAGTATGMCVTVWVMKPRKISTVIQQVGAAAARSAAGARSAGPHGVIGIGAPADVVGIVAPAVPDQHDHHERAGHGQVVDEVHEGRPVRGSAPISTLGGSPIRVAVPPMLAAITIGRKKAEPLILSRRAISDAIG